MRKKSDKTAELSPVKREQILRGAQTVFCKEGYEGACMDSIASSAGVSKATIYNHFEDKRDLLLAAFDWQIDEVRKRVQPLPETPSENIEADLRNIGEHFLRMLSVPSSTQRFRLVGAEAERFPEMGKTLFTCVKSAHDQLARFLEQAAAKGLLTVPSPEDAALDFISLCIHSLSVRLHLGVIEGVSEAELSAHLNRAVSTFLRAYRPAARG
jgi:TetR/AcrR family transcriptional regulator, mexJK operon transcriptional repressor